jgi:hypothetical protein
MIIQARLLIYMSAREIGYTYKLDRTTVTVGAPSMLAMSTIPASAGASSSTWAPSSYLTLVVREGSVLSSADAYELLAPATSCATSGIVTPVVGAGLIILLVAPHYVPGFFFPWSTGSDGGISCDNSRLNCQHINSMETTRLHYSRNSPLGWLNR